MLLVVPIKLQPIMVSVYSYNITITITKLISQIKCMAFCIVCAFVAHST